MTTIRTSYIAVDDASTSGAIVFYSLSGGANCTATRAAWEAAGLPSDWLPEAPTPHAALGAAVRDAAGSLARPIGARRGGWVIFREDGAIDSEGRRTLDHTPAARASIADDGTLDVEGDAALVNQVRANFAHYLCHWTTNDLSVHVVATLNRLHALGLRDRGGVYFVPKESLSQLHTVREALKANVEVHLVPSLKSEDAVEAVLSALTTEVTAGIQSVFLDISEQGAKKLGARALRTRQATVAKLLEKATVYENLLGTSVDTLREKLGDLQAALTVAVFEAEAATDKEAA